MNKYRLSTIALWNPSRKKALFLLLKFTFPEGRIFNLQRKIALTRYITRKNNVMCMLFHIFQMEIDTSFSIRQIWVTAIFLTNQSKQTYLPLFFRRRKQDSVFCLVMSSGSWRGKPVSPIKPPSRSRPAKNYTDSTYHNIQKNPLNSTIRNV